MKWDSFKGDTKIDDKQTDNFDKVEYYFSLATKSLVAEDNYHILTLAIHGRSIKILQSQFS